ncbi:Protein MRVI1 [Orchesella cincta]|uniref:Protein MRVI1 n=1 Tax=Orchesella cincta TaxID=48709 RepID=A0A1D2MU52_ORCCI|nr:Protein MRVI1 [Orchesella cincta]
MGSPSQSEPSDYRRMGVIPQSELPTMLQNAYDPVGRATNPYAKFLSNEEWQQLRRDQDLNDEEAYRKQFAQEEGNEEDGGAGGVEGAPQKSASAFALDEEAEKYLELLPKLVEELFQTFDVMRDKKQAPTKEDLENLERKFNHMAEVFQTDHTNLEQRITALSKDYKESQVKLKEFSQSLKSSISRLKEISKSNGTVPDDLLEVIKTLNSTSEEFEMYSDTMRRISRRMGMMDVQNRLHKMLDVMILYVHIIRTNYDNLQTDYIKAKKLLEENNVAFSGNRALGPLQNNNNNDEKCLWDEEELENSHSDRCDDGDSEPEKILQHLLGPKKSSAGLNRKERPILKEKRSSDSLLVRWMAEGYEVLRRELFWPWNLEQTIKGLKQGFSVILMILGLFVFLRGFLPSVSAIDDGCMTNPSFFKSIGEYFSYCGDLSHDDTPVI